MSAIETIRENATLIKDPAGTPQYFHFKDGLTLKPVQPRGETKHNGRVVDRRPQSLIYEFSGVPTGEWEHLPTIYPNMSANGGARLIGSSDVAWKLITESGRSWTIYRGAITKRPGLMAKVGESLLGEMTLTAVYSPTSSGWFNYQTGQTHPGYASFDNAACLQLAPAVSFGTDPWDELWPTDGAEFDFAYDLEPVIYNKQILDWTINAQTFTAKLKPQTDASWAEWLTKLGLNVAMGGVPPVANLIASYSGFYAALYNAECEIDSFKFKHQENFVEGIVARSMQRFNAGAAVALGYVGTDAPA